MVWYGMVWYGMVWCGKVWYGMVWCGVVWYGVVWYGVGKRACHVQEADLLYTTRVYQVAYLHSSVHYLPRGQNCGAVFCLRIREYLRRRIFCFSRRVTQAADFRLESAKVSRSPAIRT